MTDKDFYIQLTGVSLLSAILLFLSHNFLPFGDHSLLGVIGLVFFILLSILIFILAKKLSDANDLNAFTRLIMYNLLIKLFFSFVIVIIYHKIVDPQERFFVVPFIAIYLIFTIFEALFMSRQARQH